MKPLQQFNKYREFLLATFANARKGKPGLSLHQYARTLGLGASNFKMILSGHRNLTSHQCMKIASALRMSHAEAEHFEALVLFEQSKTAWERAYYLKRLKRSKSELKIKSVRVANQELLADISILPLLVYLTETQRPGFSIDDIDHQHLAKVFKQPLAKIKLLLHKLVQLGLRTDDESKLHFVFDKLVNVRAQKQYLRQLLKDSERRIETEFEGSDSFFTAFAFSTTDEDLACLRADLGKIMEKHMDRGNAANPSARIAQACFQVFPVSERLGGIQYSQVASQTIRNLTGPKDAVGSGDLPHDGLC